MLKSQRRVGGGTQRARDNKDGKLRIWFTEKINNIEIKKSGINVIVRAKREGK